MKKMVVALAVMLTSYVLPLTASATQIMPDFASASGPEWTVDRYAPATFGNVGTYQGRNDVLGIGISANQGLTDRAATGQNSTFYNTQGKKHILAGGPGSTLSADLFIDSSWSNPLNGAVRTDMWGVLNNGSTITNYPIIGFTNYGGARLRVWDNNGWHDLSTTINYNTWTSLAMTFTGTAIDYSVNGTSVYTDSTSFESSTGFSAVIMQAYNFDDPSISGAVINDYTANWSNTQPVPEPGTMVLLGAGMVGLAIYNARRKNSKA